MTHNEIQHNYNRSSTTPSDINEHIPTLYKYAKECDHITEMGVRTVVATWAFLYANPKKYIGYDIVEHPNMIPLKQIENASIIIEDVLTADIEETDFLFIDTYHTATQLRKELTRHADKVKKYIGFHDTFTFGTVGEQPYEGVGGKGLDCGNGLLYAISEFLESHPEWTVVYKVDNNNGLTIIERKNIIDRHD